MNVIKTKVLIFNKLGRLLDSKFYFKETCLENVRHYRYLGVHFSASGIFNFAQDDIFKKSMKASFKKVQVGKDQEKAQSEKDSHSKNRGGKKPN